jgi:hypothetical protein
MVFMRLKSWGFALHFGTWDLTHVIDVKEKHIEGGGHFVPYG